MIPLFSNAPVAQLDRAPDYESGGLGFKSLQVCHFKAFRSTGRFFVCVGSAVFDRDFFVAVIVILIGRDFIHFWIYTKVSGKGRFPIDGLKAELQLGPRILHVGVRPLGRSGFGVFSGRKMEGDTPASAFSGYGGLAVMAAVRYVCRGDGALPSELIDHIPISFRNGINNLCVLRPYA